jgi:hypothetical protein
MTDAPDNAGRMQGGQYAPGCSGNPAGMCSAPGTGRATCPKDDGPVPPETGRGAEAQTMTSKDMAKAPDGKSKPNTPAVVALPGKDQPPSLGQLALQPNIRAAVTIHGYSREYGDLDTVKLTAELNNELSNQAQAVNEGDLKRSEGMLAIQAHTLDAIFNNLAQRASQARSMDDLDRYLRLGLKAQSQCRATLEALATIKNPQPVAFVGQANIAHGPQQVNNRGAAAASRAEESENPPNKVLEHQHAERLDFGTASAAIGRDPAMATLETFDGAEVRRG